MVDKKYRSVEVVSCRGSPKGDLVVCALGIRKTSEAPKKTILTLDQAHFTGDIGVLVVGTGIDVTRPSGLKMQCRVKNGSYLYCSTP